MAGGLAESVVSMRCLCAYRRAPMRRALKTPGRGRKCRRPLRPGGFANGPRSAQCDATSRSLDNHAPMSLKISFPDNLPVSARRTEIEEALRAHQVVIVCGETGSGKTTQLPKIALAMGRGRLNAPPGARGHLIGHTQPRRIAATSVAKRIAEELNTPLGDVVGYKVRFNDRRRLVGRNSDRPLVALRSANACGTWLRGVGAGSCTKGARLAKRVVACVRQKYSQIGR